MTNAECLSGSAAARISVSDTLEPAAEAWRHLEARCAITPFQTLDWHRAVMDCNPGPPDARIVVGHGHDGMPLFVLPLALRRQGPLTIARWLAGAQASFGAGLFAPEYAASLDEAGTRALVAAIAERLPQADALVLANQRDDMPANPFRLLGQIAGAGEGYAVSLGAWDPLYEARNNRRARHNDRRREKRLSEVAPWGVRFARTAAERAPLMAIMFDQKGAWLRARGIDDFLAEEANRALLQRIAAGAGDSGVEPMVAVLEVAGRPAAISFALIHQRRCYSLITSVTTEEEELRRHSPGDILFRHLLARMCELGLEQLDLGIGSNQQKRHYADRQFRLFHTLVPLSAEGRIYTATIRAQSAAKRAIKGNPRLWAVYQQLRRLRGTVDGVFGRHGPGTE